MVVQSPKEGGELRGLSWKFLSLEVFMDLLVGYFNLINPPCAHHSIRFLLPVYHMGKGGRASFRAG